MMRSPFIPHWISKIIKFFSKIVKYFLYSTYLKEYLKHTKVKYQEVEDWILPVAAARLREKIPGEEKWLLSIIDERLKVFDG